MSGPPGPNKHSSDDQRSGSQIGYGLGLEGIAPNVASTGSQFASQYQNSFPSPMAGIGYGPAPGFNTPGADQHELTLQVTQFSPQSGDIGQQVAVTILGNQDLLSAAHHSFLISFDGIACPVTVQQLPSHMSHFQYLLYFNVPNFTLEEQESPVPCPLQLTVQDHRGQPVGTLPFGNFLLHINDAATGSMPSPPVRATREYSQNIGSKSDPRATSQSYQHSRQPTEHDIRELSAARQTLSPAVSVARGRDPASPASAYLQQTPGQAYGPIDPQEKWHDKRSLSTPSPQQIYSEGVQRSRNKSLSYPSGLQQGSSNVKMEEGQQGSSTFSQQSTGTPQLVRTSTLPQAPTNTTWPSPSSSTQPFNPYAMYPNKAFLKIEGNLDSMSERWTPEERESQRRLVEFKRRQDGNTIYTNFRAVTLEQRAPNSICVSCIWWEERGETYVTSVDTIQLLESLVGVRFTVEEKNRIRRNLEGFRPLTVAKGKSDSERFFKVIMDFPNPKPRNIEKDVKVFPWKILAHALKKIISKYSASYASAASLHPSSAGIPPSSNAPTESTRLSVSPTSASSSTTSAAQGPSSAAQAPSPLMPPPSTGEHAAVYGRQQSFPGYMTPIHTPQHQQQYMYGPVGHGWPQQEYANEMYGQHQQYQGLGTWQYGMGGGPVVPPGAQFGPAQQAVNLPLQQRRASNAPQPPPGYDQYSQQGPQQ